MKIGIIGYGSIGKTIIDNSGMLDIDVVAVYDKDYSKLSNFKISNFKICKTFDEFLDQDTDLIVEAASQDAIREYGVKILKMHKNLVIMSVGALMDEDLRDKLIKSAQENNSCIYIPSGAILGLDNLKIFQFVEGNIELTTIKNPKSLGLKDFNGRKTVFKGKASKAVKEFPYNINVAATLSLATGKDIDVEIIADSKVTENIHQIRANGVFGSIKIDINNVTFPKNPKTSYLAALSILGMIKSIKEPIKIG
ncbi:aspartate dehydrogenase [Candidatus Methanoliparum sp. LAM-1]|uniref:aspartate dehydrogenase n=1 Tax=Candidatus Methanoliparum sp. LAM-1 TaxID=2874846 RepID=UPI001E57C2E3|nr:aspartate dehydrogenase [Candidatus Methanoliparum sp. LAM-1]BDC36311.1 aspartate dehydrogenase [Candidatus Methanoliparum sp. LAM-1]